VHSWEEARRPPRSIALLASCKAEESRLHASDPDHWHTAAALWDEAAEPYHSAYCRWREAEATFADRGGRGRATNAAQTAWRTSVEIGASPMQARVERLAQRARITLASTSDASTDSPRQTVADDLGLTAREVEVLAQLALGRTDRQIADELFISKKTVSVHVSNILRKLGVSSRVDAAAVAQRLGVT
jgi:DNA-binding CsgD family transcriptional regulator